MEAVAPHSEEESARQASANTKRCHCHICACEVVAVEDPDLELRCPRCDGTCVEILEAQVPPPPPPAPARSPAASSSRHLGVICDGCHTRDFAGSRYRCLRCPDFDLCATCYAHRETIHPNHVFEEIRTPRSMMQSLVGADLPDMAARNIPRTVVTVVEFSFEEEPESQSGLDESKVAWWLANDSQLADVSRIAEQEPAWCCPICSEGLEAENNNGWIVRICSGQQDQRNSKEPSREEAEGHMYHEACLRKWLIKKNACPVCRRSPVIPVA